MRIFFGAALIFCVLAAGCKTKPPAIAADSGKAIKVYYGGTGSEHDVKRFEKFLEIALADYGMVRSDSSKDADAILDITFGQKEETRNLYGKIFQINYVSSSSQEFVKRSCLGVSTTESFFKDALKEIEPVELPRSWKKQHSEPAIYIDDDNFKADEDLLALVKESLKSANYHLVQMQAGSDAELRVAHIHNAVIPMKVLIHTSDWEIMDKNYDRLNYTMNGDNHVTYQAMTLPNDVESAPCAGAVNSFTNDNEDGTWGEANALVKTIHEHFNKEVAHSN